MKFIIKCNQLCANICHVLHTNSYIVSTKKFQFLLTKTKTPLGKYGKKKKKSLADWVWLPLLELS